MKNKISAVTLIVSLFLNANTHSRTLVENEEPGMYEEYAEQHKNKKSKKYLKNLKLKLESELEQIENPGERKAVKKLIERMYESGRSTSNKKKQELGPNFKETLHVFVDRLTSPHSIISITIAVTTCALKGILTSSIALQIIHELVSAYKWGIASKFAFYILSCIPLIKYLP